MTCVEIGVVLLNLLQFILLFVQHDYQLLYIYFFEDLVLVHFGLHLLKSPAFILFKLL